MTELKSCPFCGDSVEPVGGDVLCQNCGTFLMRYERWNRRAPRFSPEEREALEVLTVVPWLVNSEKWAKAAATIRKMLEEGK